MAELSFRILKAIFSALEEQAIEKLKRASAGRHVKNGRRSRGRQIRTACGLFRYRLARALGKQTRCTLAPLIHAIDLPRYCRHAKEAAEGGVNLVCHLSYRKRGVSRLQETGT